MNEPLPISSGEKVSRFIIGLIGLFFLFLGIGFYTFPELLAAAFFIQPLSLQGLNSLRGDFGGVFLGMSFFCFFGAATGRRRWLVVTIIFLLLIVSGRLLSFALDGFSAAGLQSVIIEIVLLIVLTASTVMIPPKNESDKSHQEEIKLRNSRYTRRQTLKIIEVSLAALIAAIVTGLIFSRRKIGLSLVNEIAAKFITKDPLRDLPDGLHVILCGSGSPMPDARRASAGTAVIAGKNLYVVDAGPGSERKLELMRINPGGVKAVLLTHFHSDHIGDLGELMLKRWSSGSAKNPLDVFGPTGVETVVNGFNLAYALDSGYRIAHHGAAICPPAGAGGTARTFNFPAGKNETVIIEENGVRITAFAVDHRPVTPAVGYRFDYKGRSVVISGDTVPCQSLLNQARGVDVLVHEALQPAINNILRDVNRKFGRFNLAKIMSDINGYHTSTEDAAKIAGEAGVKHLLLTHILPPLPVSDLEEAFLGDAEKFYKGPITIGEDGISLSLPAGTKDIIKRALL
ncbi:MAG: MBL fold metallo-hydrolase [Syntrophales bacterium]|jgi:ribonuclease Z|nr:MBL fold metallo-hydrolase [Syntrophales bacterium]